jgi:hypothetical protein
VPLAYCPLHLSSNATDHISAIITGCPRRNVRDFGRVFLMLNY